MRWASRCLRVLQAFDRLFGRNTHPFAPPSARSLFIVALLITCETAGVELPQQMIRDGHSELDEAFRAVRSSADPYGAEMAERIATRLNMPLVKNPFDSRLIDVTRSLRHPQLFGKLTTKWSRQQKSDLVDVAYTPYYDRVKQSLARVLEQFTFVVHLSVRSFELMADEKPVRTDVGLLYDPKRVGETDFSIDWVNEQYELNYNVRVRRNYPRRGTANHLMNSMRKSFPNDQYLGIEVWLNRAWAARRARIREEAIESLCESLRITIGVPAAMDSESSNGESA